MKLSIKISEISIEINDVKDDFGTAILEGIDEAIKEAQKEIGTIITEENKNKKAN